MMAIKQQLELEASEASITTATVTIRSLQVNKKQMTQSVFRQLPEGRLVDDEKIELTGEPWGWVNYHWGDMAKHGTHFIFQSGKTLWRCNYPIRDSQCWVVGQVSDPGFLRSWRNNAFRYALAWWCA